MSYQSIDVQPVCEALGAELLGVNLARPLDNQTFQTAYETLSAGMKKTR